MSRLCRSCFTAVLLWSLTLMSAWAEPFEQAITIEGDPYAIPGILSLPGEAALPAPAVLLLHGTASQKNEVGNLYAALADRLAKAGIASLRIDFAGAGDSPVDHRVYSLSGAVRDAEAALDYLSTHKAVNADALFVLGFSQGGLIAQRVALRSPRIRALMTWSTAADDGVGSFGDTFEQYYEEAKSNGFAAVKYDWLPEPLAFDLQWFEEIRAQRTLTDMKDFSRPIFAIAGTDDTSVDYQQSINLVAQSTNPASQAVVLAGANHIFNVLDPIRSGETGISEVLLRTTVSWLRAFLSTKP